VDGWFPVFVEKSYTCGCFSGYVLDPIDRVSCNPCVLTEWKDVNYPDNNMLFPKFRSLGYNISSFKFSSCSKCSNGISISTRSILGDPLCSSVESSQVSTCSFACSNLGAFTSSVESIYTLKTQFETDNFLNQIINEIFGINITIENSNKRSQGALSFIPSSCDNITVINNVIIALTQDIVPNIPSPTFNINNCSIELSSDDTFSTGNIILISVLGTLGLLLIIMLIIVLILFYNYKTNPVLYLPEEVSWSFKDYLKYPWKWTHVKNDETEYYYRDYKFGSKEFDKVEILLTKLKKGPLKPVGIRAIYNPNLTVNFINNWKVTIDRKKNDPELFFNKTYTKNPDKMRVMEHYEKNVVTLLDCNKDLEVPLIPSVHGTSMEVANKIALNSFGLVNSLDEGYYGTKSSYFSGSVCYCLPYAVGKRTPTIVISYLNMGNVFPVTESHTSTDTLMGKPIKSGYHSHYVLVKKDGYIYDGEGEPENEFVIPQESQILPSFIIKLNSEECLKEFDKWNRVIPQNSDERDMIVVDLKCEAI
jgi:hypothetical protein